MRVVIRHNVGVETSVVTVPVGVKERVTRVVTVPVIATLPAVELDISTLVLKYLSIVSTKPVTVTVTRPHTVFVTHIVSRVKKYVGTRVVHVKENLKEKAVQVQVKKISSGGGVVVPVQVKPGSGSGGSVSVARQVAHPVSSSEVKVWKTRVT
ncbi:MAG: hypothetical protein GXO43_05915 [Crenarchaeota archaeon]|nr:hypothetical protein [Thermoproteota archaeon]